MDRSKRDFMTAMATGVIAGASVTAGNAFAGQSGEIKTAEASPSPTIRSTKRRAGNEVKRILITGAGTGIGKGVALELAARGHEVVATVELPAQVTALKDAASSHGVELRVEKVNILHERDRIFAAEQDIDILVNNAGIGEGGAVADIPVDVLRSQFETNVFSVVDLTQRAVRKIIERKRPGKIVFVSSVVGLFTPSLIGAYSASKHALEAIAAALHDELKPHNIKVSTINPGPFSTGFNDRMMESYRVWYNSKDHVVDHSGVAFQGDQFDFSSAVSGVAQAIEVDTGKFRNVFPQEFVAISKHFQAAAWDREI